MPNTTHLNLKQLNIPVACHQQLIGGDIKINPITNIKSKTYQKREPKRQHKR